MKPKPEAGTKLYTFCLIARHSYPKKAKQKEIALKQHTETT